MAEVVAVAAAHGVALPESAGQVNENFAPNSTCPGPPGRGV
jgi:hypothetical protein